MKNWGKTIALILILAFVSISAGAQSSKGTKLRIREGVSGSWAKGMIVDPKGSVSDPGKLQTPKNDPTMGPIMNDKFEDTTLKELEEMLEERKWNSEDTAWERACKLGTKYAFEKYSAKYPNGPHIAEAKQKIIDLGVEEVLNNPHRTLPGFKHVAEDPNSEYSTIQIENKTGMILHILFSGLDSKELYIYVGATATITVLNGDFKLAALVDSPKVRPFAGAGTLTGGQYEVTFYINSSYYEPPSSGWLRRTP